MCWGKRVSATLVVAYGLAFAAQGSIAQESGSFAIIAVLEAAYVTLQQNDERVFAGPLEGDAVVTESTSEPFVVGHQSDVNCLGFGRVSAAELSVEAPCNVSSEQGILSLVANRTGKTGQIELLGGTGVYESISGTCQYEPINVSSTVAVSIVECTWQR